MADVLVIVPPELADGFHLAGSRVWPAADAATARGLLLAGLDDADAGIIALADDYFAALDGRTRRMVERRARPVVVALPTRVAIRPEQQRRAYLAELIRRAVGLKVVLGGRPAP
jgi:vacuolar-type H+-ATPase subunit F/Vma7